MQSLLAQEKDTDLLLGARIAHYFLYNGFYSGPHYGVAKSKSFYTSARTIYQRQCSAVGNTVTDIPEGDDILAAIAIYEICKSSRCRNCSVVMVSCVLQQLCRSRHNAHVGHHPANEMYSSINTRISPPEKQLTKQDFSNSFSRQELLVGASLQIRGLCSCTEVQPYWLLASICKKLVETLSVPCNHKWVEEFTLAKRLESNDQVLVTPLFLLSSLAISLLQIKFQLLAPASAEPKKCNAWNKSGPPIANFTGNTKLHSQSIFKGPHTQARCFLLSSDAFGQLHRLHCHLSTLRCRCKKQTPRTTNNVFNVGRDIRHNQITTSTLYHNSVHLLTTFRPTWLVSTSGYHLVCYKVCRNYVESFTFSRSCL